LALDAPAAKIRDAFDQVERAFTHDFAVGGNLTFRRPVKVTWLLQVAAPRKPFRAESTVGMPLERTASSNFSAGCRVHAAMVG
jgi:hypothetical protein